MKGLVFRELYLGRKNMLLTTMIWFMFVIIGILMRLSMLYGNMAKLSGDWSAGTESILCNAFIYVPVLVFMSMNIVLQQNINSDYKTKWALFGFASPVSEYRYIGAKFLLMGGISCAAFIINLINTAVMCTLCDRRFDSELILSLLCVVMCMIIFNSIYFILTYITRDRKKLGIILGITGALLYIGLMGGAIYFVDKFYKLHPNMSEDEQSELIHKYLKSYVDKIKDFLADAKLFLLFIFIAVMIMLYFVCVKVMKRRER